MCNVVVRGRQMAEAVASRDREHQSEWLSYRHSYGRHRFGRVFWCSGMRVCKKGRCSAIYAGNPL
jgi:hypothetical protein